MLTQQMDRGEGPGFFGQLGLAVAVAAGIVRAVGLVVEMEDSMS